MFLAKGSLKECFKNLRKVESALHPLIHFNELS